MFKLLKYNIIIYYNNIQVIIMKTNNKKIYNKPELKVHGDLVEITQKIRGSDDSLADHS